MTTGLVPAVWALFDRHDQDAAVSAALGLRRCANEHRLLGTDAGRRDAVELDRLADDLELIVEKVRAAWRESHPPGPKQKGSATAASSDGPDDLVPGEEHKRSARIVPGNPARDMDGSR